MKNGFTLIELLAVLIILSIIALIATVSVGSVISTSKDELSEIQQNNIEEAAKAYYLEEGMSINDECVSIQDLVNKGYVDGSEVKNPKTGSVMTGYVKITYEANQYTYEYQEKSCIIYTAITESKTGNVPTIEANENIKLGSEFKIKVNDEIDELTFFVLSNDGNYVNLIAEQNITSAGTFTSGLQEKDDWYKTSDGQYLKIYGPTNAYDYLKSATDGWTNIPIIERFSYEDAGYKANNSNGYKSIEIKLDSSTGKYKTIITPNPSSGMSPVIYEDMRARLPYEEEIVDNNICSTDNKSCKLWMVNYLANSTYYDTEDKKNSSDNNYGYWLLNTSDAYFRVINNNGLITNCYHSFPNYGIRPVITVEKEELIRAILKNTNE